MTAEASSSSPEYVEEYKVVIDRLLRCNFTTIHVSISTIDRNAEEQIRVNYRSQQRLNFRSPYISETVSDKVRKFIRNRDLPVNVIFKPGVKLQELFCSSRPHNKRKCTLTDCKICPNLPDGRDCTVNYPVYRIVCQLCSDIDIGKSSRKFEVC